MRLGISTHDETELEHALSFAPDYVALGPIYPTLLKQMPWAPQGLARLTQWKRCIGSTPLVAIGGLTAERIVGVFDAGADSAAVVTDIVRHSDPERRTREWLAQALRWEAQSGDSVKSSHSSDSDGPAPCTRSLREASG